MIAFTCLAFQVIRWHEQDISVSIVSETEEGNKEVTISVRNTAGSTLLFYENADLTGKIEYLSEDGWVEYCDVVYTNGNASAISPLYGGVFAELQSGESWDITIPEDKVERMQSGTYRIKMTYITEGRYNKYLDDEFKNRVPVTESDDPAINDVEKVDDDRLIGGFLTDLGLKSDSKKEEEKEKFLAEDLSEVFIKTFEYKAPDDFIGEISIASSESPKPHESNGIGNRNEEFQ